MNILTIDVGTSIMKQYLFTGEGQCLWEASRRFAMHREGRTVEMDARATSDGMERMMGELGRWCEARGVTISAVALTSQRSSVTGVDGEGRLLLPMMMWQDRRADEICREFDGHKDEIRAICGMTPTSVYSAPKILWMKRHRPQAYRDAERMVGFYEWLLYRLTGRWATDDSVTARSCLTSLEDGRWSERLLELFEVDRCKLCEILDVGGVLPLRPDMQALLRQQKPLATVLAGGDQQCAAVGAGCLRPGDVQINTGTGGYVLGLLAPDTARDQSDVRYNRSCLPPLLLAEASIAHCGTAVDRLAAIAYGDRPDAVERFSADAQRAGDIAPGLRLDPDMLGDRARLDEGRAREMIEELVRRHGGPAVNIALLDGIIDRLARGVRDVLEACAKGEPQTIACGGGLTRSAVFCQRLADHLGIAVRVPGLSNVTAAGALVMALRALRPERDIEGIWRQVHHAAPGKVYTPSAPGA